MRVIRRITAFALVLMAVSFAAVRASGAAGSLTVHMTWKGHAVAGGSLILYEVAEQWEDVGSPAAVEKAVEYVRKNRIQGQKQPVGQTGMAYFDDLKQAVYLVMQDTPAQGFRPINPFLISMKEGVGKTANPKLVPDDTPQTGDDSSAVLWLILMAASLVGVGGVIICKIRGKKDSSKP